MKKIENLLKLRNFQYINFEETNELISITFRKKHLLSASNLMIYIPKKIYTGILLTDKDNFAIKLAYFLKNDINFDIDIVFTKNKWLLICNENSIETTLNLDKIQFIIQELIKNPKEALNEVFKLLKNLISLPA
jgi:hypothetical protein